MSKNALQLTPRQAAIISAYTGITLCRFDHIQDYAEEKLGFTVMAAGMSALAPQLKKEAESDFMQLLPQFSIADNRFYDSEYTKQINSNVETTVEAAVNEAADKMWDNVDLREIKEELISNAVEIARPIAISIIDNTTGDNNYSSVMSLAAALHAINVVATASIIGLQKAAVAANKEKSIETR